MPADPPSPPAGLDQMSGLLTGPLEAIRSLFGAAACSCALVEADGEAVRFVAAAGAGAASIVDRLVPLDRGIVGWVAATGQPIATADLAADPRFARDVAQQTGHVPASIMAAPLVGADGEVLGVVEVLDRAAEGDHTGRDLQVLGVLAAQLALVVELAAAHGGDDGVGLSPEERRLLGPSGLRLVHHLARAVLASDSLTGAGG